MNLRWSIDEHGISARRLVLAGAVTEHADFSFVRALPPTQALALDLEGIEQVNSCGVREWIQFIAELERAQIPFELLRCSPAIVRQLNMVSNFKGTGAVRSIVAPYYCEACGHEEYRVLELSGAGAPRLEETVTCSGCGEPAEFDDIPSTYLAFTE